MQNMLLIQNGCMIDPKSGKEGKYDLLIEQDCIVKIGKNLELPNGQGRIIDAGGLIVAPGLVDVHVHFREPGFTYKEDIKTGAQAAAKGGFTSVVLMANTKPAVDNPEILQMVLKKGKETKIHVYSCSTVTRGMQGKELVNMEEMAKYGALGFTDDGVPIMDADMVEKAMESAAWLDMPISFHEEDPSLITNNGVNRGEASDYYGIGGSPREAEITLVERDLQLAVKTGAAINIQHISTREAVELVRQARKQSRNIHAEATPHHFTLNEKAVIKYGTLAKMNPPLREEEDRLEIIRGLIDGTIDLIATDHAPHAREEKEKDIIQAPSGIIGLETALSLGITTLVKEGHLTMKQLLAKMSTNPAALYHLNAGYLCEGGPADIVLIDTEKMVIPGHYASKSDNTPFTGWKLYGQVVMTICNGQIAYEC